MPLDQRIIEFFTTGFGNSDLVWLGHLVFFLICMLMAGALSGIVGFEREFRGHAAGFRTHILVALGSALIMYVSIYGFDFYLKNIPGDNAGYHDPARLAAQVVSGIGFLGAGAIIQTGTAVKGLTTATTLWLVMAIGLAAGSGNIVVAAIATVICMVALISFRGIERLISRRNPMVTIVVPLESPILKDLLLTSNRFGVNIKDIDSQVIRFNDDDALRVKVQCSGASNTAISAFVEEMKATLKPLEIIVSNNSF